MSLVKLPYHPEVEVQVRETRFGVLEITEPLLYEKPIAGKVIMRADLLEGLREDLGDNALRARNTTYSIISGNCDDETLNTRFASYYRKYSKVTEYVNRLYEAGSTGIPLVEQLREALSNTVKSYTDFVRESAEQCGGKYLVTTHCYMYYAFAKSSKLPEINGVKIIC